jgi:circadian clock protein KaiB
MPTEHAHEDVTAEFEKSLTQVGEGQYVLRLYLTGSTSRSIQAVTAIKNLCEQYLKGRYDLEVVDLYQQPDRADTAQIIAAPTLVKELPLPLRRLVGDLTSPDRVLIALNLKPESE